jgi:hypothetical protein
VRTLPLLLLCQALGVPLREGLTARASDFGVRRHASCRTRARASIPASIPAPSRAHFHVRPHFSAQADVVLFDLLLTMDKFTTADVMREVSMFDTIDTSGRYTVKVRTLVQFHRGRYETQNTLVCCARHARLCRCSCMLTVRPYDRLQRGG